MKISFSLTRERLKMKNAVLLPHCGWCSSQRRWVVKRPSPWPPEPLPEPMPGLGAMPPRGGGPLPSRIIPLPTMPLDPPEPRSLRLMSRRSSPPRVSLSRTALVFFSSTFRRTSPRNIIGLAPRILCTGSESSKTTNPKLGSFPPTPLVFIRSSTTFPYVMKKSLSSLSSMSCGRLPTKSWLLSG